MNSKEDSPPSVPYFRYSTPLSLLRLRQNSYRRLRRRRTTMTTSPMSSLSSPSTNGGSGDHNQFLLLRRRDTYPSFLGRHNNNSPSPDNLSNYDDVVYFLDLALAIAAETTNLQINAQAAESSTTSSSGQRINNNGDKSQSQDKHDQ